jgi:molecular chaperone GrpE (heat shock protein)
MSEQKQIDSVLQGIADKILHDLPEELAATIKFSLHEGGDGLILNYPANLEGTPDFKDLDVVVRRYGGAFVSRGKGKSFYLVPKPADSSVKNTEPENKVDTNNAISPEKKSPAELANEHQRKREAEAKQNDPAAVDPKEVLRDRVIREIISLNIDISADQLQALPSAELENLLKVAKDVQRNYTRAFEQVFEKVLPVLDSIAGSLELLAKNSEVKTQSPFKPVQPQQQPAAQPPQSTPVQRSTRPTEGHQENGIVWVNDVNQRGEPIEKAFVKDNERSDSFNALDRDLYDAAQRGKKGLEHDGKWYWLSQQQDYIGRKVAKQFPKTQGGRRY